MRRVGFILVFSVLGALFSQTFAHALSSGQKLFISGDNTFYAYVKAGETIGASFAKVDQNEPFDTVRGDVTVTIEGPDIAQQSCVMKADVAIGKGCNFANQVATKSGVWRIQFAAPAAAKTYPEVSTIVKWGANLFNWSITIKSGNDEQHGRIWTERYAIRQPAAASYLDDLVYYYVSEDGYIYKTTEHGYNGQISTLSADSIGIRKGTDCTSVYQSVEVSNTKYSPALGSCGNAYKLFFETPAGDMPAKATQWDGKSNWILPSISRPSLSELHFTSDKSTDQQSGTISFFLRNFIGQYQVKIDTDNDGGFDGQSDVVLNQQMKSLSNGLQQIHFQGVDKQGQVISPERTIGIKVEITKVAEIHLIAADVEGRTGGLEMTRLNGDNAPTTRVCWNDTELVASPEDAPEGLELDGRDCPTSVGGVHSWEYGDGSWGNERYIDDWAYASAKLAGNNTITYPDAETQAATKKQNNFLPVVIAAIVGVAIIVIIIFAILRKKGKGGGPSGTPPQPPVLPTNPGQQLPPVQPQSPYAPPSNHDGDPPVPEN